MPGAEAAHGEGGHAGGQAAQGLDVFDAQGVVGALKQGGDAAAQLRRRFLPGLGEGEAAFQMVGEQIGEARGCQHVGGLLQRLEVAAFAAEAEDIHAAQGVQQGDRAEGEALR